LAIGISTIAGATPNAATRIQLLLSDDIFSFRVVSATAARRQ